ncbi:hypothetical protein EV385_2158 [Krasilnikovia cinnamomea]|uniref:DUF4265 domain-containing protein n=2 Tax=Krasilnikovia cinnamomea TaxID=349313 RepID=A0A4V2G6X4_9ACTN|nr:hypothetical protein EV385_2158 [Krasilnikovia cinnamomea]
MVRMAHWAVIIPADTWATERLFHHDTLTVAGSPRAQPGQGDEVLLLAGGDQPVVVALGSVAKESGDQVVIAYRRRAFDEPVPATGLSLDAAVTEVDEERFRQVAARLGGDRDQRTWLVSVDLPIEATTPAEAVRQFWSYVRELGPAELPAFVSPTNDELAMQAFVLGEEANLDPEEDDED